MASAPGAVTSMLTPANGARNIYNEVIAFNKLYFLYQAIASSSKSTPVFRHACRAMTCAFVKIIADYRSAFRHVDKHHYSHDVLLVKISANNYNNA